MTIPDRYRRHQADDQLDLFPAEERQHPAVFVAVLIFILSICVGLFFI